MKKSTRFLYLMAGLLVALFSGGILLFAVVKKNMWIAVGEVTFYLVLGITLNFFLKKYVQSIQDLPVEVRQKRIRLMSFNQKNLILILIVWPLMLVLLPLTFLLSPDEPIIEYLAHDGFLPTEITMLLMYAVTWEMFLRYRRVIKLVKSSEIPLGLPDLQD